MKGKNFKYALKINDISQEKAAEMLNVTRNTITRWCKMEEISEANSKKIVEFFRKNGIDLQQGSFSGVNSSIVGSTVMSGNGNKISNNDYSSFFELLKKKDEQIDKLLRIIEKLSITN